LHSLKIACRKISHEIIVVDNHSQDGSIEMLEKDFKYIKLIKNKENFGFAKAVNQGIITAKGDYVLLVNSDMIVPEEAIEEMLAISEKHQIGILGPKLVYPNNKLQGSVGYFPSGVTEFFTKTRLYKIFNYGRYIKPKFQRLTEVDWVSGGFMLIKKEVIDKIRFFDEKFFMYVEDVDFCYRAKKAGFKVAFTPAVSIIHFHQASSKNNLKQAHAYERASIRYFLEKYR
jgi:GT2 family glycosyltransferase